MGQPSIGAPLRYARFRSASDSHISCEVCKPGAGKMEEYIVSQRAFDIIMSLRHALTNNRRIELDDALEIAPRIEIVRQIVVRNRRILDFEGMIRIQNEIQRIGGNPSFARIADMSCTVRNQGLSSSTKEKPVLMTFGTALDWLARTLREAEVVTINQGDLISTEELQFNFGDGGRIDRLNGLVPEQKLAPVQFKVEDGFLTVDHVPAATASRDSANAVSAREQLVLQGKTVVEELRRSNCDLRFLETVMSLQAKLETADDIIQLGIINTSCGEMAKRFDAELSDAVAARLHAHISSVNAYVAQFPDWRRYTENAAIVELDERDVRQSLLIADEMISKLAAEPELVDPEVPRTIKLIKEAVGDPGRALKRTSFALLRTMENLFSKVFEYLGRFASDFATQTSTRLAKWGSRAAAGGLIPVILGWAATLTPIYERLPDASWLKPAIMIIRSFGF